MSYTGTQVMVMAQRYLVDVDDGAYSDDMLDYLNEGSRRFATETQCCQAIQACTFTAQSIGFSTIADLIANADGLLFVSKVEAPLNTVSQFLPKAPLSEMRKTLATGVVIPTRYTTFAKTITLDTDADQVLSLPTNIYCSYVPEDIVAGDDILIPAQWVQALVKYIVYCARVADRDSGLANGAFADYEAIRLQAAMVVTAQTEGIPSQGA